MQCGQGIQCLLFTSYAYRETARKVLVSNRFSKSFLISLKTIITVITQAIFCG